MENAFIEFLYYSFAFLPGVTINIFLFNISTAYKNAYLRLFTTAYLSTSLLVFYYLINGFTALMRYGSFFAYYVYIEVLLMCIILWSVSTLIVKVFSNGLTFLKNILILFMSFIPLITFSLRFFKIWEVKSDIDIYYVFFIIILILNCLFFLFKYRQINHQLFRKFGMEMVSILSIFLIYFFIQLYIPNFNFDIFPLLYLLVTIQLIKFILKHLIKGNLDGVFNINKDFIEKYGITKREQEIIRLIQDGYSNAKISRKLYLSEKTVANHIYNIYKKMDITSRFELICMFKK